MVLRRNLIDIGGPQLLVGQVEDGLTHIHFLAVDTGVEFGTEEMR